MQAIIDKRVVSYNRTGKGKAIVMLHGWGSKAEDLKTVHEDLAGKFSVISVDLPGFGASEAPGVAWDLTDYANFLNKFLSKIKTKPYALVTHSNGAAIAIKALAGGFVEAEKLVVMGGAGIRPKKKAKKLALTFIAKTGKLVTIALPKSSRRKLRNTFYTMVGSDYRLVEGMEETFKNIVSEDVLKLAPEVTADTLLIYGEKDEATPPVYGQLYYELLPSAQLEVIGGAGHFVFTDKPEQVKKMIQDFLK